MPAVHTRRQFLLLQLLLGANSISALRVEIESGLYDNALPVSASAGGGKGCHYLTECVGGPCGPPTAASGACQDTSVGDICPGQECSERRFGRNTPQFHVAGTSCGMNDPNGPMFDPVHKLYHIFWQDHISMVHNSSSGNGTSCGGPVWGHAVSKDFAHWSNLRVALWNDQWWDLDAVYTGSVSIVGGTPAIIYPGICDRTHADCAAHWGVSLAAAVPADPTDPLYEEWTKRPPGEGTVADNPLVQGVEGTKDPSTAWRTQAGEWRLTTAGGIVYHSWDFVHWSLADSAPKAKRFPGGECPALFRLPALVPGTTLSSVGATSLSTAEEAVMPTHVHKHSEGGDWMQLGVYDEGAPNSTGSWTATGPPTKIDHGSFYASKPFYDPVKDRQILWGWAMPASLITVPREITFDPRLSLLCFNPARELEMLRVQPPLANFTTAMTIPAGSSKSLGNWSGSVGNTSDVTVRFKVPAMATTFGLGMMTGPAGIPTALAFVDFVPPPAGDAGNFSVSVGVRLPTSASDHTPDSSGPGKGPVATLQMLPGDTTLDIRCLFDNTVAELFWMGGRVAMTVRLRATKQAGFTVFASAGERGASVESGSGSGSGSGAAAVELESAQAWRMGSMWVSKAEVLRQHRASHS